MPDRYRVITTDRAYDDLDEVLDYIAQQSPQNAAGMIDQLISAIESLDLFPGRYPIVDVDPDTGHAIHSMPVKSYLVRYRIERSLKVVYVMAVRHGARDDER